ncbi:hypothetical protein BASA81_008498 [Batrachochytrium salamandrivorans]|nr:hypothetical protein BASA81_008498 [Batrachochytrium salamandrivorans]
MANSDISVPSVDHRQEPYYTLHSRYTALQPSRSHTSVLFSLQSWVTRWSMSPRSTAVPQNTGARFRITVPEDRQRNIIQRLERQSKQTHWRIRQNYRHRRPDPASTNSPTSTTITADPRSQCCQYQQQTTCYSPYRQEHQALGHLRDLHYLL